MTAPSQTILKCLMLSSSGNDNEALVAIRKANQILATLGKSWEEFLGIVARMDEEESRKESEQRSREMNKSVVEKLRIVKEKLLEENSPALEFIESLENGLSRFGSLTPKQAAALHKFYVNATKERAPF